MSIKLDRVSVELMGLQVAKADGSNRQQWQDELQVGDVIYLDGTKATPYVMMEEDLADFSSFTKALAPLQVEDCVLLASALTAYEDQFQHTSDAISQYHAATLDLR